MNRKSRATRHVTTFYIPEPNISGDVASLPAEEAKHATRVLRFGLGDPIEFVDGGGGWYRGVLCSVRPDGADVEITDRQDHVGEPAYRLTLCVAILKDRNRFETLVEKASELGAASVVPLLTEHTERATLNLDRLKRVAVAAMKQCGRSKLLAVSEPVDFTKQIQCVDGAAAFLCHENSGDVAGPMRRLEDAIVVSTDELFVFVGPEGGFSVEEVRAAESSGVESVTLGPRRLRTETAAIMAAAVSMAKLSR